MFIRRSRAFMLAGLFLSTSINVFSSVNSVDFFGAKAYGGNNAMFYATQPGDFDGDGNVDVLTSSYNTIYVFFGAGNGEFGTTPVALHEFLGGTTNVPVAGDFNGDGRSDVALLRRNPQTNQDSIAVYLGLANRTFAAAVYSAPSPTPKTIFVADLDSDGKQDLIGKALNPGNVIQFYKGDGAGAFASTAQVAASDSGAIVVADFDNDNLRDVAFTEGQTLRVARNLGENTFDTPAIVDQIDYGFSNVIAADVNNDGEQDLVASQSLTSLNVTAVWLGSTGMTFTHAGDLSPNQGDRTTILDIADLDLDGNKDLILCTSNRTLVRWGEGSGTFATQQVYVDGGHGGFVADVDSNGQPDIVATQSIEFATVGSGSFSVLLNQGDGFMESARAIRIGSGTQDLAVANFNSDPLKDIVIITRGSGGGPGNIYVFFQSEATRAAERGAETEGQEIGSEGVDAYAVVTGRFDADNFDDIIVVGHGAYGSAPNAIWLKNLGNNTFAPSLFQIGTGGINEAAATDLNNDSKLDLVTTTGNGVQVSFGNGDGTFASPVTYISGQFVSELAIGDANNDLRPDIAAWSSNSGGSISILVNDGSGVFTAPTNFASSRPFEMVFSDLNSDGFADLAAAQGDGIGIFYGNGSGGFGPRERIALQQLSADRITTADLNSDGLEDIAVLAGRNTLVTLVNNNNGTFGQETLWGSGVEGTAVTTTDLDNDGKSDVVVGFNGMYAGFAKLFYNTSSKAPATGDAPFDFDGDGKTDVGIFRPTDGTWWIQRSSTGVTTASQFGAATDRIVPADFTGDGKTDHAVWRPSTGEWFVLRSDDSTFYSGPFGTDGDVPMPTDYDADGKADTAVFRPSNATWYIQRSSGGVTIQQFGATGDIPVAADYDGDAKADLAIFRPGDGNWWLNRSTAGVVVAQFGNASDKLVPGDYTGDGKTDVAFWRPADGSWFILRSEDFSFYAGPFGANGDIPAPGDYDGDGKFDTTVFRPSNATWYSQRSSGGVNIQQFGATGDTPVPSAYVR